MFGASGPRNSLLGVRMTYTIRWARVATVLFAAVIAAIGIAATTTPARAEIGTATATPRTSANGGSVGPATSGDCLYILNTSGYRTTPDRLRACNIGEGGGIDTLTCFVGLINTGVNRTVAGLACNAADD